MTFRIIQGDNRDTLETLADNSVDAIVTDPPYGIDFLGKSWDANTGALETYQECLRVLKPGGHILAFSAARTYHHLAVTLEQAGFEIRDQIMWIYSSGFPKSQDIGKSIDRAAKKVTSKVGTTKKTQKVVHNSPPQLLCSVCNKDANARYDCKQDECGMVYKPQTTEAEQWVGWGTQLKPAHEPIALARKPLHKSNSIARNCQQWGVGALNIDATRVKADDLQEIADWHARYQYTAGSNATFNNILSEAQGKERQQHDGDHDSTKAQEDILKGRFPSNVLGEIPLYQKYFYCPKVSRAERHIGFDIGDQRIDQSDGEMYGSKQAVTRANIPNVGNNHPTVKPVALMEYLIKLITPPGGTVLDPFNGSGSTGMAAVSLGYDYIGCELDPAYVDISTKRITAWQNRDQATNNYGDLFEE
jgi:DNA modification methylase